MKRGMMGIAVSLVLVGLVGAGCSIGQLARLHTQSHFSYPNSNVTPIGNSTGESVAWSVFVPIVEDADLEEEAVTQAIKAKGGDMLVDYISTTSIRIIPLYVLTIYRTSYEVKGTVVKMELGKQILH